MKWKKGICLLTVLLLSISTVSYAEEELESGGTNEVQEPAEVTNTEENTELTNAENDAQDSGETTNEEPDTGDSASQEASDQKENEEQISQNQERIIWGTGSGITAQTQGSESDQFGTAFLEQSIVTAEAGLNKKLEAYVQENSVEMSTSKLVRKGQIQGTKTAFYEYTNMMIITSENGTYRVSLPMLNTFISSGSIGSMGAPLAEQTVNDGYIYQKFANGTLSCQVEKKSDTLVVRRGNVYYFKNSLSNGEADKVVAYGRAGDEVLIGDWDGDGVDTLCVRRGNTYYFKNSISQGEADTVIQYGRAGDKVLVGDWDGDGVDTLCVRRGKEYHFKNDISSGVADAVVIYGRADDKILTGDWDGDGVDTLCVRRGKEYHFKNSISAGPADTVIIYGKAADDILVGDWDGDGMDTLCVRRKNEYHIKNNIQSGVADSVILYGRASDITYSGTWSTTSRLEYSTAENISFNQSQGFGYSQLTQAFAGNSINGTAFRKNALTTYIDGAGNQRQYCAYYDNSGTIVLAARVNEGEWNYQWTAFKGDITDAHNVVSLAVDGAGYLHMAWSYHAGTLMYAKSTQPNSMTMNMSQMIGTMENSVTYPEFYVQPTGDMFFLYRNGSSGEGNLVLNRYSPATGVWQRVQDNLISGEGRISPYWQAYVDNQGRLHLSWVWRETADASTNYNMSYAVSADASGNTFVNSLGQAQKLPITEATAEKICEIPKNSSLINQTSMTTDGEDKPYIISYWRVGKVVQYNIIRFTGEKWIIYNTDIRSSDFVLSGTGTRQLPCARPQILVDGTGDEADIYVLFRDDERNGKASIAKMEVEGSNITTKKMIDITGSSLGEWEPNYDISLWKQKKKINIFMQKEFFTVDGKDFKNKTEKLYVADVTTVTNE